MKNILYFQTLLFTLFGSHFSFSMESSTLIPINDKQSFIGISQLTTDLQVKTFACSRNKNNWRATNKYWSATGSINAPSVYNIARHDPFSAAEEDKIRIAVSACYYKKYNIVQNILNNTDSRMLFHYVHGGIVWDLYGIAQHIKDEKMLQLLEDNKVIPFEGSEEMKKFCKRKQWENKTYFKPSCRPTHLEMACFSGDRNRIPELMVVDFGKDIYIAVDIILYFDAVHCLKILLKNKNKQSKVDYFLPHVFFEQAFHNRTPGCNVLNKRGARCIEFLLNDEKFDINKISCIWSAATNSYTATTLRCKLNELLQRKKDNPEFRDPEIDDIIAVMEKRLDKENNNLLLGWASGIGIGALIAGIYMYHNR